MLNQSSADSVRAKKNSETVPDTWLRLALSAAQIGTWDWDIQTGVIKWSENLEMIHGMVPGAFDGTFDSYLQVLHPEDRNYFQQAIQKAIETKTEFSVEFRILWPDHSIHWMMGKGRAFYNEADQPERMIGLAMDITVRKAEEAEQQRSVRRAAFEAEAGAALSHADTMQQSLQTCVEAMVRHLDAVLAGIWTLGPGENELELKAIAGTDSHPRGWDSRILIGQFEVGRIAEEREPHLTNNVLSDPRISDQEWTRQENITGFAGFPLLVEERVVGVIAMFSREPILDGASNALVLVADTLAQTILRRYTEEALRKSEELWRTTLHSIGDAVIATDAAGRITFMNSVAEHLTGWPQSEALGKSSREVFRIYNEHTGEEVPSPIERVLQEGIVVGLANHTVVVTKEGATFPIEDSGAPIKDETGQLLGVVLVFRDVTESRNKEQIAQQSELRFRLLVEQSPQSIQILAPDGRTVTVNRAWEELWGLPFAAIRDYNMLQDKQLVEKGIMPYIQKAFAGEAVIIPPIPYDTEQTLPNQSKRPNTIRWTQAAMYPVKDETGQVREVVLMHEDITERKEVEKDRAYMAAIIQSSNDAIVSKDLNGIVTSWNLAAERIYGYKAEEIVGKSKALVIPPSLPDELPTILRKIRAGERIEHYETLRVRKDGTLINLSISVSPVLDSSGTIIGASTIARDISERTRHLREIEELNARLQRSIQETHHRVKNNLQIISALVDVQTDSSHATVPVAAMNRIGQHTRSLAAIHDLLTQQSKVDAHSDSISTKAAMDKLIPLLQATTGGRRIRYHVDDISLPIRVGASLALLVSETVSNAVKHGKGDIELTLTAQDQTAHLEVCDDGPGFPPDFDWQTAANTGLSLIDSAARHDLHGTISYENRQQGGARVSVIFSLLGLQ